MNTTRDEVIREFIDAFDEVFDRDWAHTKQMLGIHDETPEEKRNAAALGLEPIYMVAPDGTFLQPKVEDETEDWGNRGRLLSLYRELKKMI